MRRGDDAIRIPRIVRTSGVLAGPVAGPTRIDEQGMTVRRNDERRLPTFHIDEIDLEIRRRSNDRSAQQGAENDAKPRGKPGVPQCGLHGRAPVKGARLDAHLGFLKRYKNWSVWPRTEGSNTPL